MKLSDLLIKHGLLEVYTAKVNKELKTATGLLLDEDLICEGCDETLEDQIDAFYDEVYEIDIENDINTFLNIPYPTDLVLVSYADNWADEMDIEGYYVTTATKHTAYEQSVQKYFEENSELSYCIGSNENIEYSSAQEVLNTYTCIPITLNEYHVLKKLDLLAVGFSGPEIYKDEDDEDDEDE